MLHIYFYYSLSVKKHIIEQWAMALLLGNLPMNQIPFQTTYITSVASHTAQYDLNLAISMGPYTKSKIEVDLV